MPLCHSLLEKRLREHCDNLGRKFISISPCGKAYTYDEGPMTDLWDHTPEEFLDE